MHSLWAMSRWIRLVNKMIRHVAETLLAVTDMACKGVLFPLNSQYKEISCAQAGCLHGESWQKGEGNGSFKGRVCRLCKLRVSHIKEQEGTAAETVVKSSVSRSARKVLVMLLDTAPLPPGLHIRSRGATSSTNMSVSMLPPEEQRRGLQFRARQAAMLSEPPVHVRQGVLAEAQRAATLAVQTAMQQAAPGGLSVADLQGLIGQAAAEAATAALENWRTQVLQGVEIDEDDFNIFPDSRG